MSRRPILDDFTVAFREDYEIEKIAEDYRRLVASEHEKIDDVELAVTEIARTVSEEKLIIRVASGRELGRSAARYIPQSSELLISRDVSQGLRTRCEATDVPMPEPEACMTMLHELGHIVLHPRNVVPLSRMRDGNIRERSIPLRESAEHQANTFMRCFAMSRANVLRYPDHVDLALYCNVPSAQAVLRLKLEKDLYAAKRSLIAKGTDVHVMPEILLPVRVQKLWDELRHGPNDYDPRLFRMTLQGSLIQKAEYSNRKSHLGWIVANGLIVRCHDIIDD